MKKLLLFILLLFGVTVLYSQTFNDSILEYTVIDKNNNYVSVGKYNNICPRGALTIPKTIENNGITFTITNIKYKGFFYCTGLTNIDIPDSLASIEDWAFYKCRSLINIDLPVSITSIGRYAFSECSSLINIVIPDKVTRIEERTFDNCRGLTSVTIPDSVTSIEDWAFAECFSLTSIDIPDSVTNISFAPFYNCTGLTSVIVNWATPYPIDTNTFSSVAIGYIPLTVPSGSEYLYETAEIWQDFGINFTDGILEYIITDRINNYVMVKGFVRLSSYPSNLIIPRTVVNNGIIYTVTSLENSAFSGSSLKRVNIPDSIISLGNGAFNRCINLSDVVINAATPIEIDSNVFSGVPIEYISLTIPIGSEFLYGEAAVWKEFDSIFIDGDFQYKIRDRNNKYVAIKKKNNISFTGSVTIPETVKYKDITYTIRTIRYYGFSESTDLTSINIPDSVTNIEEYAFSNCTSLTSVDIPDSVTNIGDSVFAKCSNLTSIDMSENLISISNRTFIFCTSLSSINIPKSVTTIEYSAFFGCTNLSNVVVNWSTPLVIEANTFGGVAIGFIPLTVPSGTKALYKTTAVWQDFNIMFTDGILDYTIIDRNNKYVSVKKNTYVCPTGILTIPKFVEKNDVTYTVTNIEERAFANCDGFTNVNIPDSVTTIEDSAFANCEGLTSIVIPDNLTSIGEAAFHFCTALTSINISDSVTSILFGAFQGCSALTSVIVNWETPLVISDTAFRSANISNIPLTVPSGTEELYAAAAIWQDFGSIVVLNIENFNSDIAVDLYPNPVKNKLNITLKKDVMLEIIKIYNSLGQFIKSSKTSTTDISNLLKGIYLIEITTNKGQTTKKFIVE